MNGGAAAIRAGYAEKSAAQHASRALADPRVKTRIDSLLAKQAERIELNADWIVSRLMKEAEGDGKDTTQAGRVRALELLGKRVPNFFPPQKLALTDPSGTRPLGCIVVPAKEAASYGDGPTDSGGGVETHAAPG
ncbi:hypothetical protein GCM10009105_31570 [Dokdonella soli]|uniref:Terminase small subunit n=2 Tax=Dokdonella soli TaxID=529810 RepID=A0ABN1IU50_9GAMM